MFLCACRALAKRFDDLALDDDAFLPAPLALAKGALGRHADPVDAGPARRLANLAHVFRHLGHELPAGQHDFRVEDPEEEPIVAHLAAGQYADAKKQTLAALEIAPSFERAQDLLLKISESAK